MFVTNYQNAHYLAFIGLWVSGFNLIGGFLYLYICVFLYFCICVFVSEIANGQSVHYSASGEHPRVRWVLWVAKPLPSHTM